MRYSRTSQAAVKPELSTSPTSRSTKPSASASIPSTQRYLGQQAKTHTGALRCAIVGDLLIAYTSLLHQYLQAVLVPITFPPDFLDVVLSNLEPMRHVVLQQKLQHTQPSKCCQPADLGANASHSNLRPCSNTVMQFTVTTLQETQWCVLKLWPCTHVADDRHMLQWILYVAMWSQTDLNPTCMSLLFYATSAAAKHLWGWHQLTHKNAPLHTSASGSLLLVVGKGPSMGWGLSVPP